MDRARYDQYVQRFNAEDATAFDEFIAPDMRMLNGALEFRGIQGMRDHYERRIWPYFRETLEILKFVASDAVLAAQLRTHFLAKVGAETLFGTVVPGDQFEYRGIVMYEIGDGRFTCITVAYNSFTRTNRTGDVIELGMPH